MMVEMPWLPSEAPSKSILEQCPQFIGILRMCFLFCQEGSFYRRSENVFSPVVSSLRVLQCWHTSIYHPAVIPMLSVHSTSFPHLPLQVIMGEMCTAGLQQSIYKWQWSPKSCIVWPIWGVNISPVLTLTLESDNTQITHQSLLNPRERYEVDNEIQLFQVRTRGVCPLERTQLQ